MRTQNTLKVGLLGIDREGRGFGARAHIPGIKHAPGVELIAVCTRREESAKAAAEYYQIPRYYAGVNALLDDPDIDLINVAVRVRSHYPVVWEILRRGKHVYCEWPLGLNSQEAQTLVKLAREKNVITGVGNQGRFAPGTLYMRDLIEKGYIGQPLSFHLRQFLPRFTIRSDHWWSAMGVGEEHSGALGVATGHLSNTLRTVLGEITRVAGLANTLKPHDRYEDTGEPFEWTAEDSVSFLAEMENGTTGTFHVSHLASVQMGFQFIVFGTGGQLVLTSPYNSNYSPLTLRGRKFSEGRPESGYHGVELEPQGLEPLTIPSDYYWVDDLDESNTGHNLGQAMVAFRRAWEGGAAFRPSFEDGLRTHRLVQALKTSSETRTWVDV